MSNCLLFVCIKLWDWFGTWVLNCGIDLELIWDWNCEVGWIKWNMTQQKIVMQNMIPVSLIENWTILLTLKKKIAKDLVRGKKQKITSVASHTFAYNLPHNTLLQNALSIICPSLGNITKLIKQITNSFNKKTKNNWLLSLSILRKLAREIKFSIILCK